MDVSLSQAELSLPLYSGEAHQRERAFVHVPGRDDAGFLHALMLGVMLHELISHTGQNVTAVDMTHQ